MVSHPLVSATLMLFVSAACVGHLLIIVLNRSLEDRFGGNGALSLRRVSAVKQVLRFQTRLHNSDPADRWLSMRMGLLPDAKMAPGSKEAEFSVENIWHDKPMGYRLDGILPDSVWGDQAQRKKIYAYCPEVKIIHEMKLERQRCQT